jgi:hypothetical protein
MPSNGGMRTKRSKRVTKQKELPAPECSGCGRSTATMTLPLPIEGPEVTTINLCDTCHMKAQARMLDFPDQPCSFGHDRQAVAAMEMIIDDGEKIPVFYCESCILIGELHFEFGMDALDAGALADSVVERINGILLKCAERTWGKEEAPSHIPPWPKCDICKSRPALSLIDDKAHGLPVKIFLCLECFATEGRETMLYRKHLCSFCTEEANTVLTSLKTGLPIDIYLGEVCSSFISSNLVYHVAAKLLKIED